MAVNSVSSLSQLFKAMPSQVNASKNANAVSNNNSAVAKGEDNFSKIMNDALEAVDKAAKNSVVSSDSLLTENPDHLHSVVLAAEKAEIALNMTMQVRNKALDAYQEIMRMQL